MLFENLPFIEDTTDTELLVYKDNVPSRMPNTLSEQVDAQVVNLVLSRVLSQGPKWTDHLNNKKIHLQQNDSITSLDTTWSSTKIDNAISGSSEWLTLDQVPEGTENLYFTEERARKIVEEANLALHSIEHKNVASAIVSVWQGWNTQTFWYYLKDLGYSPVTVEIDGVQYVDSFPVTPGVHTVKASESPNWLNNEFAHEIGLSSDEEQRVITPELTLDAFKDGEVNKFWRPDALEDTPVLDEIVKHIQKDFATYHNLPLEDSRVSSESTWSSLKIVQFLNQQLAIHKPPTETKEFAVFTEGANSGQNVFGYTWHTTQNNDNTYTHYILRKFNVDNYRSNLFMNNRQSLNLQEKGNWFFYWIANTNINPYFTNVTNVKTYLGETDDPKEELLEYPGVLNKFWNSSPFISLITKFTTDQDYNSEYNDKWLVPQSIPNKFEVYSQIHIEKIT